MSKRTNALLFRFGISTLWLNKSVKKKKNTPLIKLEVIIHTELKKKNLQVFIFFPKKNKITIFVYSNFNVGKYFRVAVVKYYLKVLSIYKVISKFGLSKLLLCSYLKKKNFSSPTYILISKALQFNVLFYFCYKYCIYLFFLNKGLYKYSVFDPTKWVLTTLFLLLKYKEFFIHPPKKSFVIVKKKSKLRKINSIIKFKLMGFHLENVVKKKIILFISICVKNIFYQKGIFFSNNIIKKYKKQIYLFKTILLSVYYMKSKLITDYISEMLRINKKHRWLLRETISLIEVFFLSNILKFKGLKLRVAGKLNGKMRKSKYSYQIGKVELQTVNCYLTYSFSTSYTKFGVISTKI
jgi:hypothetical protein